MGSSIRQVRRALRAACVLTLGYSWAASAGAADAQAAAGAETPETESASAGVQEIVVTARRRQEALQDVPVAVTAFTAETLERMNVTNITNTLGVTPGLYFTQNGLSPNRDFQQLIVRGVGVSSQLEPSVGTFIDGVYVPALGFDMGYLDVDHIEVLKGPQGALFGRNTEGGAVNIVLRKPDDQFRARTSVSYDNFNTAAFDATVSGPLVAGKLFASFAGKLQQSDYWVKHTGTTKIEENPYFPGQDLIEQYDPQYNDIHAADGQRESAFRAALRYVPSDDLELYLSAHVGRFRGVGQAPGPLDGCKCYTVYDDLAFRNDRDSFGAAFTLTKNFAPAALSATFGYESVENLAPYDYDGTSIVTNNYANYYRSQSILSAEFRLTSTTDSPLQWLAGLYGFKDRSFTDRFFIWTDLGLPGSLNIYTGTWNIQHTRIERPGAAAFGQLSYDFTPKFQLALGGRYSWERAKDSQLAAFEIPANGLLPYIPSTAFGWEDFFTPVQDAKSWTNFSPQVALRYKWRPDLMTYVNVAKGFKAGAFQIAPVAVTDVYPIDPESTINHEVGLKGDFFDQKLSIDASAFYVKIKNQQLQSVLLLNGILTSAITTASSSHSQGAELSLAARPTERLTLNANVSYTKAEFDDYLISPEPGVVVNRKGDRLPDMPKWTYFASAAYKIPFERYALELSANYRYVGSLQVGGGTGASDPLLPVDSWDRLDVSAALLMDAWTFRLFSDNVTDNYIITAKNVPFTTPLTLVHGIVDAPRRVGISVAYKF